ncbi:MAG: thiamine phosphate synthase [Syntrophobacteraceae bacterium]
MKNGSMKIDYGLYLVTDRVLAGSRPLADIILAAIRGGVTAVQLREKNLPAREFLRQAFALKRALSGLGIPLIINDRLDIALACGADGVHLGQEDIECSHARRLAGRDMIIGVSVNSAEEAAEAEAEGADYLGAGPVFATSTKLDASSPTGLSILWKMRQVVRIPVVGIGGITAANAADVIRSGADGVAVVSAIIGSANPEISAKELRASVDEAKRLPADEKDSMNAPKP